jgi:hypothetical protein
VEFDVSSNVEQTCSGPVAASIVSLFRRLPCLAKHGVTICSVFFVLHNAWPDTLFAAGSCALFASWIRPRAPCMMWIMLRRCNRHAPSSQTRP